MAYPKLARDQKLRLKRIFFMANKEEEQLITALIDYRGEERATYIRNLVLEEARRINENFTAKKFA